MSAPAPSDPGLVSGPDTSISDPAPADPAPAPAADPAPAPAAPPAPIAPKSFLDGLTGVDSDTLNHPAMKEIKDLPHLAKRYVEIQSMIGRKSVQTPGPEATPEEWNAFYDGIGRPQDADSYSFVGNLDETIKANAEGFLNPMLQTFHEAGLSDAQASKLAQSYIETAAANVESQQARAKEALNEATTELRGKWGEAYDSKMEYAMEAAEALFGERMSEFNQIQLADGSFLADNPMMAQLLSALGESGGEGSVHPGGSRATLTPEEAEAELNASMADEQFLLAYKNRDHPQHKAVLKRRLQLREMMNPEAKEVDLFAPRL